MTSKFTELAIDCADPHPVLVLGARLRGPGRGRRIVTIGSPHMPEGKSRRGPVPPVLTFARVPEGKTVKDRVHLDLNPTDRDQADEVVACSASAPGRSMWDRAT